MTYGSQWHDRKPRDKCAVCKGPMPPRRRRTRCITCGKHACWQKWMAEHNYHHRKAAEFYRAAYAPRVEV